MRMENIAGDSLSLSACSPKRVNPVYTTHMFLLHSPYFRALTGNSRDLFITALISAAWHGGVITPKNKKQKGKVWGALGLGCRRVRAATATQIMAWFAEAASGDPSQKKIKQNTSRRRARAPACIKRRERSEEKIIPARRRVCLPSADSCVHVQSLAPCSRVYLPPYMAPTARQAFLMNPSKKIIPDELNFQAMRY
jgi:hypothetical protein